jgi:tRNA pseudouridine55 synthase
LNGLLLVDKPVGITSFDVIRTLRRVTGVKKIGHAGTLDPLASGLMIVLFGAACKSAQNFSKLDKAYISEITLGFISTTGDNEGDKTVVSSRQPDRVEVEQALGKLMGEIEQTPSVYSAIKIDGKEAYKRARAGEKVKMPSRLVTVYESELIHYDYPKADISCRVSSGTYVRTLAEDLGSILGVGAYLTGLRRTTIGPYVIEESRRLDILDMASVVRQLQPLS